MTPQLSYHDAYQQALKLMRGRSPDKLGALVLLRKAAVLGSPEASYALGTWYLFGEAGLRVNKKLARKHLQLAAAAGLPNALFDLALMYEKGEGGPVDLPLAYRSYVSAALRGDAPSVFEVARCLHYGIGCASDIHLAEIWAQRAKELEAYESE